MFPVQRQASIYGIGAFGNRVYDSVAEVQAETGTVSGTIDVVNVGRFRWDPTSTDTEDGVSIIQVSAISTGRYHAIM